VPCLVAAVALTGACDAGGAAKPPSPSPSVSQDAVTSYGKPAKAILDRVFVGREEIGSGYGRLEGRFGNTAPDTAKDVLSATFAFTCSGGGKVTLGLTAAGKDVPTTARTVTCDKSVSQQSVETPGPGALGFRADTADPGDGDFAYAYYVEKRQAD